MMHISSKVKSLEKILADMHSVLVAYSGGTDKHLSAQCNCKRPG